jgi:hypothetical protein
VEVGEPVAEPRAQVQQHGGRSFGDPCVAIGGAGGDASKERQDASHLGYVVEGRDEVHLGRAGFMKHTSTPAPTSVRMSALAPFTECSFSRRWRRG